MADLLENEKNKSYKEVNQPLSRKINKNLKINQKMKTKLAQLEFFDTRNRMTRKKLEELGIDSD